MKSDTINLYKTWMKTATREEIEFVDSVYELCERHYDHGGDEIVECYGPKAVLEDFETLEQVKEMLNVLVDAKLDRRAGDDDDRQMKRQRVRLTNELADIAACGVTFDTLCIGEPERRKMAWQMVLRVIENTPDEAELNKWWRSVMRDAAWRTHDELKRFAQRKISEIKIVG